MVVLNKVKLQSFHKNYLEFIGLFPASNGRVCLLECPNLLSRIKLEHIERRQKYGEEETDDYF